MISLRELMVGVATGCAAIAVLLGLVWVIQRHNKREYQRPSNQAIKRRIEREQLKAGNW